MHLNSGLGIRVPKPTLKCEGFKIALLGAFLHANTPIHGLPSNNSS